MNKWIWCQESLPCKVVITSIVKDFLLQNIEKWTLRTNEEQYTAVKQIKKMTKLNPKKDKLIRLVVFELLHNVILCFSISVIVFRIYDWKKFQICFIPFVFFFSKPGFLKILFFGTLAKMSQECLNQFEICRHSFPH